MYQSEMKEGFIKDYLRSRVVARTSLYSLFRKIEPFEEKNKTEPTTAGGVAVSSSYARHISPAFIISITQDAEKSNWTKSAREVSDLDAEYSRLYDEYRAAQVELRGSGKRLQRGGRLA